MVRALRAAEAARRRLTAAEYERMAEAGILHEDERIELIDGELVQMAAIGSRHMGCVIRFTDWFGPRVAGRAHVSVQNPLRLSDSSEPQPDIVLLRRRDDAYSTGIPTPEDVLLLIEVADSSVKHDRDVKLPRYAAAGIVEVWLASLQGRRITAYREPSPEGYRRMLRATRGGVLSPLAFPDLALRWEEIFG